ncbi:MAG TPA: FHA domain-containing protein [Stellaceae bacterium]
MDPVIWIEILSRHRAVVARYRVSGPEIRIGRGYGNDVVIDDPYLAVEHVRIRRDESGALVAEDIGTANGMFSDRSTGKIERVVLDGDRIIRIGQTYLRARDASYAVVRERPLKRQIGTWPVALALAAAILGMEALSLWLGETNSPKLSRYLPPLLGLAAGVLSWSAAWAILCRIFSGQARFERNLLVALVGLLVLTLYSDFAESVGFALSWYPIASYDYVASYSIVAAICFWHLRVIGPSRLKIKAGVVAALAVITIAAQTLPQIEARDYAPQNYARHLMPPALRLAPLRSESGFFADVERLKSRLDRDRAKPASASGDSAPSDSED